MHGQTDAWRVPGYTEMRELGTGGAGRVVLAQADDGPPVAIKYLAPQVLTDPNVIPRLRHEARLLAGPHPNVARCQQYVETQRGVAVITEVVNGVSLRALLRAQGPTGPEAALTLVSDILAGLAAIHEIGVIHRDCKPENVVIDADGTSTLVDVGIAVPIEPGVPIFGTPPYLAPERWAGAPAGPPSDLYAAAVILFECLTGSRPFRARSLPELARQHQSMSPPVEEVPPPLRELLEYGLTKPPMSRPRSAREFLERVRTVAAEAYGPAWATRGRRRLATLAGLLVPYFPLAEQAAPVEVDPGETGPRHGRRKRTSAKIGVTVAVLVAIAGGSATLAATLTGATESTTPHQSAAPTAGQRQKDPSLISSPTSDDFSADSPADDKLTDPPDEVESSAPTARPTPNRVPAPRDRPTPPSTRRSVRPSATPSNRPTPSTPEPSLTVIASLPAETPTLPPEPDDEPPTDVQPPEPAAARISAPVAPMGVLAAGLLTTGLLPATLAVKRASKRRRRRQ